MIPTVAAGVAPTMIAGSREGMTPTVAAGGFLLGGRPESKGIGIGVELAFLGWAITPKPTSSY